MRLRPSRRTTIALFAVSALAATATVGFDRYVRARVAEEAERRHLDVSVVAVRPTWSGVRLVGVRAEMLRITIDADHTLRTVAAARATITYEATSTSTSTSTSTATPTPTPTPTPTATPTATAIPSLPELHTLRARARALAALL